VRLPKPARCSPKPSKRVKRGRRARQRRKGGAAWAGRECDRLWSQIVHASGPCYLADRPGHVCSGSLQAAHGFSRRYRVTRWLPINGFRICSGAHVKYTHDPLAWDQLLREWWGQPVYDQLRSEALSMRKMDPHSVLGHLRAELQKRGAA
jgi:hypothetical protein